MLHVAFGLQELEELEKNHHLVYVVRKSIMPTREFKQVRGFRKDNHSSDSLPAFVDNFSEAMSDMPEQFIIGSMKGSYMHQLTAMIEDIIKPILNLQLRVPAIHEKNVLETTMEADDSNDKIIDFSRPSDYRMKAIEATQLGVSVGDDASHLSGTSRMSTVGTATSTESLGKTGNTPYEGTQMEIDDSLKYPSFLCDF